MAVESSSSLTEAQTEAARKQQKRKNNIWGSVLQEQDLTQTMVKSAGVESVEGLDFVTRDVESYNFTNKYLDTRPDLSDQDEAEDGEIKDTPDILKATKAPSSGNAVRSIIGYDDTLDSKKQVNKRQDQKCGRKRKAEEQRPRSGGIFDRLGAKKMTTTHLGDVNLNDDMEPAEIVKKIAEFLHEPKVELIGKKPLEVLQEILFFFSPQQFQRKSIVFVTIFRLGILKYTYTDIDGEKGV